MAYTNLILQQILDAMPDAAGLNQESTQQAIETILQGLATETKLEAVRVILQSIYDDCCPNTLLTQIRDAMPSGGDYALESSMQTSLSRLQSILDRITSIESDLGYDSLLDPLDTQKKSLDVVQDKLQDILAAMPDVAALMTDAKGEAIRALLQSIYDDCCPNTLLTSIKNNTYDSRNHLSNIAAESSYQTIRLAEIRDRVALETTLQAIQAAMPSTSGLALEATLQMVRANTDHLDQMESQLATIQSTLAAIQTCVCDGGAGGCTPCPDEDSEFSDKDPEYEGDDPVETNPPPDDYSSWSERNRSICRRANWLLEQMIKDAEKASDLIGTIGEIGGTIAGAVTAGKAVKGLASEGAITLAKKGLTAKGWIPISVYASIISVVAGLVWSLIKSDIEWVRCELVNVIYQNRKQGSAACHEAWDAKVDERFQVFSSTNWALKLWMWDTSFEIIYQPEMWASETTAGDPDGIQLTMEPCLCYDAPAEWHNPDLMVHTHDSLRDMVLSGSDIVEWNNTGALGGEFTTSGSPQYTGGAVVIAPNKKLCFYPDESHDGRYDALYVVLSVPGTDNNRHILIQDGQDSTKPNIRAYGPGNLQLQLRGKDFLNIPAPVGRVVLGMRADPDGQTYYTLNGAALGDAAPSGGPGCYPPLCLGSPVASYSANAQIWAVVGYKRYNMLTAAQETDIVNNLLSLYPV